MTQNQFTFPSRTNEGKACFKEYLYSSLDKTCQQLHESCPPESGVDISQVESWNFHAFYGWTNNICYRTSMWMTPDKTCYGKDIRQVCVFSMRDLPEIRERPCLIANKFGIDVDPIAILCQVKLLSQLYRDCLLYTSPSPRDRQKSRMPSSA